MVPELKVALVILVVGVLFAFVALTLRVTGHDSDRKSDKK